MPEVIRPMRQKIDTAARWASINPVLGNGEIGIDTTNRVRRTGDGVKTWTQLSGESIGDKAFSFVDTFSRAAGPLGSNYQVFTRYAASELMQIGTAPDVFRNGAPSTSDWADCAVLQQNPTNLAQRVEVTIGALNTNDSSSSVFSGYPGVSAVLRAPGGQLAGGGVWTGNNSGAPGIGQAVFVMLKPGGWFVFVAEVGSTTTPNGADSLPRGWCALRGSGTFTGNGILAGTITSDDYVSLTYKGATVLPPTLLSGAPRNTFTGFGVGAGNAGNGTGNRVLKFVSTNA